MWVTMAQREKQQDQARRRILEEQDRQIEAREQELEKRQNGEVGTFEAGREWGRRELLPQQPGSSPDQQNSEEQNPNTQKKENNQQES